jgi:hypothetical protein
MSLALMRNTVISSAGMPVFTGDAAHGDSGLQADARAVIEHALADRTGDWRGSILGSHANDRWETKLSD